jgi:hypothetical protein
VSGDPTTESADKNNRFAKALSVIGGITALILALAGLREAWNKLFPEQSSKPDQVQANSASVDSPGLPATQAARNQRKEENLRTTGNIPNSEFLLRANSGFIYLGRRDEAGWVIDQYSAIPILTTNAVPHNGDVVTLNGMVHLRQGVPPPDDHLAMTGDLGTLRAGTRLHVGTVTRLDPEGFYWAQVRVIGSDDE